ncbi:BMC domain-containing protein [Propionibacterium freudenreichii]|uniref:BMC domain-containing protein n=3 Tax=Propionibacterium freudenreichii TaxID=1744 RepID=UPI00254B3245|nr:BMC domain-containing protein [Propionibacterium freudenreichii]MDK9592411.1 BMC domain-containing protein [Propionibacterium freudenreichii]
MQLTQALGTIEVLGLPAAITAADVACKAADVRLVGYETTDGMGMVTVKITGQVSAVQSAIAAARAAASQITSVFAESVIPRPNDQIDPVVLTPVTVGLGASPAARPGGGTSPEAATPEQMAAAEAGPGSGGPAARRRARGNRPLIRHRPPIRHQRGLWPMTRPPRHRPCRRSPRSRPRRSVLTRAQRDRPATAGRHRKPDVKPARSDVRYAGKRNGKGRKHHEGSTGSD